MRTKDLLRDRAMLLPCLSRTPPWRGIQGDVILQVWKWGPKKDNLFKVTLPRTWRSQDHNSGLFNFKAHVLLHQSFIFMRDLGNRILSWETKEETQIQ